MRVKTTTRRPWRALHACVVIVAAFAAAATTVPSATGASANSASAAATGAWADVAPLPVAESAPAAAVSGGKIYVLGYGDTDPRFQTYVYDPRSNHWSVGANSPYSQCGFRAVTTGLDGRIYVFGGLLSGFACPDSYAFDPRTGQWAVLRLMPLARLDATAVTASNGKIYVLGGDYYDHSGYTCENSAYVYDPTHDSWSAAANLPHPEITRGVLTASGHILLVGGARGGKDCTSGVTADVDRYQAKANRWLAIVPLPKALFIDGAALGGDGHVYAVGGSDEENPASARLTYRLSRDATRWAPGPRLHHDHAHGAVVSLNGDIYIIGGTDFYGQHPTASVERLAASR